MKDILTLLAVLALGAAVVWGLITWSRRGQRKIKKASDDGWKEAGRKD